MEINMCYVHVKPERKSCLDIIENAAYQHLKPQTDPYHLADHDDAQPARTLTCLVNQSEPVECPDNLAFACCYNTLRMKKVKSISTPTKSSGTQVLLWLL